MTNARKPPTQADRARRLVDKGLTVSEAAAKLGTTRSAVWDAARARKPRGRPPEGLGREKVAAYVKLTTATRLRARASETGGTLGEVIDDAIEATQPVEPPASSVACSGGCGREVARQDHEDTRRALEWWASASAMQDTRDAYDRDPRNYRTRVGSLAKHALASVLDAMDHRCSECAEREGWAAVMK